MIIKIPVNAVRYALLLIIFVLLNGLQMSLYLEDRAFLELRYQEKVSRRANVSVLVNDIQSRLEEVTVQLVFIKAQVDGYTSVDRMTDLQAETFIRNVSGE